MDGGTEGSSEQLTLEVETGIFARPNPNPRSSGEISILSGATLALALKMRTRRERYRLFTRYETSTSALHLEFRTSLSLQLSYILSFHKYTIIISTQSLKLRKCPPWLAQNVRPTHLSLHQPKRPHIPRDLAHTMTTLTKRTPKTCNGAVMTGQMTHRSWI